MADIKEIGHEHRFTSENQPINRKSRKGIPTFKTIFQRYLKQDVTIQKKDGSVHILSAQEAIVLKAIQKAIETGDVRIIEMIMNRTDGLPVQAIKELSKKPLQILFTPHSIEELNKMDNFESNIEPEVYVKDPQSETNFEKNLDHAIKENECGTEGK